jgi:hypothetical protein
MTANHDTHATPPGDHDAHAAGPQVDAESSPVDVAGPTPLSAFIWPGIIALLVLLLVWGPVTGAFSHNYNGYDANGRPSPTPVVPTETAAPAAVPATLAASTPVTGNSLTVIPQPTTALSAVPTDAQGGGLATETPAPALATYTPLPTATVAATDTAVPPTETAAPATVAPAATPTTGAALPPAYGDMSACVPRTVAVAGKSFPVQISNTTLPDWVFSKDPNVASWVSGTVVNYVLGISYSSANAALFAGVHDTDTVKLTCADGAVYSFTVDQVQRVAPSNVALLAQDHPAITLLLLGDPAPDRALIQGHFSDSASR